MENAWKTDLSNRLQKEIVLAEIADYLKGLKAAGILREEIRDDLAGLRPDAREQQDDRIREVLDIVEGFAS